MEPFDGFRGIHLTKIMEISMPHCSLQEMICPIFLDFSQKIGEVNLFRCKLVHLPPKLVHLPPRKGETCNASLTAYIVEAGLMLRVIWKELL